MRFKNVKNSIKNVFISGIILSLFIITACGNDSGSDGGVNGPTYDPIDTSYAKTFSGGVAKNISEFNGKSIYALISFMPSDKRESDSGFVLNDPNERDWTLTTTAGKSMSFDNSASVKRLFSRYNVNLSRKTVFGTGQTDCDMKMRTKENKALAAKVKQFSRKTSGRFSKAPTGTITKDVTTWSNVIIPLWSPYHHINTTCRYISDHAYFFVDDRDTAAMSSYLSEYGTAFDAIYDKNHNKFGTESDVDGNGKVIIVFSSELELEDGLLGYFNPDDKYAVTTYDDSNEGDIFYMTTDSSFQGSVIKGTLAHEFQHMIYFDQHVSRGVTTSYAWLNEALSQAAEFYNGYTDNHNEWIDSYFNGGWYGLSLTYWSANNYGYGAIFIRYLIDQYGDTAIKNMCSTDKVGVEAVESATGEDFNTIFYNFTLALAMSGTGDTTDPKYNFTLDLMSIQATPRIRGGLMPSTDGPIVAGNGGTSWNYPYEVFFIDGSGTFSTMTLSGNEVIGTAFGLNQ